MHSQTTEPFKELNQKSWKENLQEQFLCPFGSWCIYLKSPFSRHCEIAFRLRKNWKFRLAQFRVIWVSWAVRYSDKPRQRTVVLWFKNAPSVEHKYFFPPSRRPGLVLQDASDFWLCLQSVRIVHFVWCRQILESTRGP